MISLSGRFCRSVMVRVGLCVRINSEVAWIGQRFARGSFFRTARPVRGILFLNGGFVGPANSSFDGSNKS